jgi:hypothetical protein
MLKLSLKLLEKIQNDAANFVAYENGVAEIEITVQTPDWFIVTQKSKDENEYPAKRKYQRREK